MKRSLSVFLLLLALGLGVAFVATGLTTFATAGDGNAPQPP
jgi:hypothetical protein